MKERDITIQQVMTCLAKGRVTEEPFLTHANGGGYETTVERIVAGDDLRIGFVLSSRKKCWLLLQLNINNKLREHTMNEYHYTECGLDNIYLINGFEITKNNDDEEIFIHDIHGLHKAIGMAIVFKQGLLLGDEIKFIRTTLDFSQTRLAQLLGCSYQTILLWEKNKTPISKTADRLLRVIFFEYLTPEKDRKIYDLINEIADFDADLDSSKKKIVFEETLDEWRRIA